MDILDGYIMRARLFPAILGIAPAIAFLLASVAFSWETLGLPQVFTAAAVGVLFFGFSDIGRQFGRRAEKRMFSYSGGRPFPTVLRHRDSIMRADQKNRYLTFLGKQLQEKPPTPVDEEKDPLAADNFYMRCGDWLRERTRDLPKFKVLFEENVTYGFRRNTFGLKWFGLGLNAAVVVLCGALIYLSPELIVQYGTVVVFAALHATYFLLVVNKKSVLEAADQYGRQLVLSCESLMNQKLQ